MLTLRPMKIRPLRAAVAPAAARKKSPQALGAVAGHGPTSRRELMTLSGMALLSWERWVLPG
jgi:hypothetical protein